MQVQFPPTDATAAFDTGIGSLGRQLHAIHDRILETAPEVARVACALYDRHDDLLKTFINSTREGVALRGYQYRLSDSESLSLLARTRIPRLLTDLPAVLEPTTAHSSYVLDEGYRSSFTVPMCHRGEFIGFVFFDSREEGAFTPPVVRELMLHAGLITMAVANELVAISSVVGTIQLARDFTELRDFETGAHIDRMARYARIMARDTSRHFGFTDEDVEHVMLYAPMHDIGKIGIPDSILLKPGPLTEDEWVIMRTHTLKGSHMVASILRDLDLVDLPDVQMLRDIVELHHERLDGSGYPHGLMDADIPPAARIVAVADGFDALTSHRPYKHAWSFDDAFALLRNSPVDQRCVEALIAARPEVEQIRNDHPDA